MPQLLKASLQDDKALTDLTMRSKGYWGYSPAQLKKWTSQLTITKYYLNKFKVCKLVEGEKLLGYYSWAGRPPLALLDNMFIDPDHLHKGYGSLLMNDFLKKAKAAGYKKARVNSDPNATGFYLKFRFVKVGELQSVIPGRFLPIMERKI
jgi:GNAT superfamily N-acetyltransferase